MVTYLRIKFIASGRDAGGEGPNIASDKIISFVTVVLRPEREPYCGSANVNGMEARKGSKKKRRRKDVKWENMIN